MTYLCNHVERLNNFGRRTPEKLFKEIVDAWTDGRTDGRWTTDNGPSQKLYLSTLCSGELKMNYILSSKKKFSFDEIAKNDGHKLDNHSIVQQ